MKESFRDYPLKRFSAFFLSLCGCLIIALLVLCVKCFTQETVSKNSLKESRPRLQKLEELTQKQLAERNTYKDFKNGNAQVKPEDVFHLGRQMGLFERVKPSNKQHGITFNK